MAALDTVQVHVDLERFQHPVSWARFIANKAALERSFPSNMIAPG